ncbi:hypothetical protein FNL50_02235 [Klebsiella michiganensis]|nr:hypothetical protein FNL50_02235 [Klebsiella michiganensis]
MGDSTDRLAYKPAICRFPSVFQSSLSCSLVNHYLGQILGQNGVWGTVWGNQMSVFVCICPEVNNAISLKILQNVEFAKLFFCMP